MCVGPSNGLAQSSHDDVSRVTHELMSPFCPGLLLADCGSQGAFELREEIARRIDAGERADAIEDDLIVRFGPRIRTIPEFSGFGLLAWMGPPVIGLGGFAFLVAAVRASTRRQPAVEVRVEDETDADPAVLERVQDELDDLD